MRTRTPIFTVAAPAYLTRTFQQMHPHAPVRGLSRISRLAARLLPAYRGRLRLPGGVQMEIDTHIDAHLDLLFTGVYQPALAHRLRQRLVPGAHCLDIGANVGFFALDFAQRVGAQGRVAAFEANPVLVELLETQRRLNAFTWLSIHPQAAYETSGQQLTFHISRQLGKSSLDARLAGEVERAIEVETIAIDDFIAAQAWPRLDVIKIDAEGADALVLLGAQAAIARFRPLVAFEFKRTTPDDQIERLRAVFEAAGYRLEMLHHSGLAEPFAWQVPGQLKHIDVVASVR